RGMGKVARVNTLVSSGAATVGSPLPDAPLVNIDGKPTSLRAYAGHPLWVNFFATWCVPCKAELPEIERRYMADKSGGLIVLGVDQQESSFAVAVFVKSFGVTYPIAIDQGAAANLFAVHTIPLSMFVDASGTVRSIRMGQMQPETMDAALQTIL